MASARTSVSCGIEVAAKPPTISPSRQLRSPKDVLAALHGHCHAAGLQAYIPPASRQAPRRRLVYQFHPHASPMRNRSTATCQRPKSRVPGGRQFSRPATLSLNCRHGRKIDKDGVSPKTIPESHASSESGRENGHPLQLVCCPASKWVLVARPFWLPARRDDALWRAPHKEEQRGRGPKGPRIVTLTCGTAHWGTSDQVAFTQRPAVSGWRWRCGHAKASRGATGVPQSDRRGAPFGRA